LRDDGNNYPTEKYLPIWEKSGIAFYGLSLSIKVNIIWQLVHEVL